MKRTEKTACILCSRNCGIEVDIEDDRFTKIRGDDAHPISTGYICQKAARLDHYQNDPERLTQPMRRRPDGTFEPVSWASAIADIAGRLVAIRERHGGKSFAYYGGGGQGNHLGGVYGSSLLRAMGSAYHYSALAQEKTGDFWINGKLFGRQTCHTTEDVERAEVVLFAGTNPWQAHGIPNAREVIRELAADPKRTMIVIDPRRTETADRADVHVQIRPSTDAFFFAAMLGVLVREDLVDHAFLAQRTKGYEDVRAVLAAVDIEAFASKCGVPVAQIEDVARRLASAKSACVRADLGLQQSLHSTLNSYLEKLTFLLTGNLGKVGGNNFHTFLLPLIGHTSDDRPQPTAVTKMQAIGKLYPPNILPAEIDNDAADRVRAVVVDSANPLMSGADTPAYRAAFEKLELLVVIDVALTETAELAHYVLPAASQFEKWEATFFNLEFPTNAFHLRAPLFEPRGDTLPEPEIYRRLLVAMGALPDTFPWLERVAKLDRRAPQLRLLPAALAAVFKARPDLVPYGPLVLYSTLGKALPNGARSAAVLWFAAQRYAARHEAAVRRAGVRASNVAALGEALFQRILDGRSGVAISTHEHADTWAFVRHADRRVHLAIPQMLEAIVRLADESTPTDEFVLVAGERRAYNANTIYRDPEWRKNDPHGAMAVHPDDAERIGLVDGGDAKVSNERGSLTVVVRVDDRLRPGMVSLPHGYGMKRGGRPNGPALNEMTKAEHRDAIAATPFHKYVPVMIEPVSNAIELANIKAQSAREEPVPA